MAFRSTLSGSGQPWGLQGQSWNQRWSQGCSGIKQNMPISSRASQHLAPAAWKQINTPVSTQLCFSLSACVEVCSSPTCSAKLCFLWAWSSALPLLLLAHPLQTPHTHTLCFALLVSVASISFPVWNFRCLKFLFHFWRKENNSSELNLGVLGESLVAEGLWAVCEVWWQGSLLHLSCIPK